MIIKPMFLNILKISFLFAFFLFASSCKDDAITNEDGAILPYNKENHIYGLVGNGGGSAGLNVIDLETGKFERIQNSQSISTDALSGSTSLFCLDSNRLLLIDPSNDENLVIHDLNNFEKSSIRIYDEELNKQILFPQLMKFGLSKEEVFIIDTDASIWQVNLNTSAVKKLEYGIPKESSEYVSDFFFLPELNYFIFMLNDEAINASTTTKIIMYDIAKQEVIKTTAVNKSFGFQQDYENNKLFYSLELANEDRGIRLNTIFINELDITVSRTSTEDLSMENLSAHIQTIHSRKNVYIVQGLEEELGWTSPTLYLIDINTGLMRNELQIEDSGNFTTLNGE